MRITRNKNVVIILIFLNLSFIKVFESYQPERLSSGDSETLRLKLSGPWKTDEKSFGKMFSRKSF